MVQQLLAAAGFYLDVIVCDGLVGGPSMKTDIFKCI